MTHLVDKGCRSGIIQTCLAQIGTHLTALFTWVDKRGSSSFLTRPLFLLWLFLMPVAAVLAAEWLPRLGRWFRLSLGALIAMQALNCVMLDRDLMLFTDLEMSQARKETGLWKLHMTERGFDSLPVPAFELSEPPDKEDGEGDAPQQGRK